MSQEILDSLNVLLTTIITGVIGIIGVYISIYLNKLKEKAMASAKAIEDDSTRTLVNNAIERLNSLIVDNVKSAQLTLVKEITENAEDGYSKEDLIAVKDVVQKNILKQLNNDSKELVKLQIEDLNGYIDNKIEVALGELKGQLPTQ